MRGALSRARLQRLVRLHRSSDLCLELGDSRLRWLSAFQLVDSVAAAAFTAQPLRSPPSAGSPRRWFSDHQTRRVGRTFSRVPFPAPKANGGLTLRQPAIRAATSEAAAHAHTVAEARSAYPSFADDPRSADHGATSAAPRPRAVSSDKRIGVSLRGTGFRGSRRNPSDPAR
jgi:hypothetical protein